jgi:hypothetical protein
MYINLNKYSLVGHSPLLKVGFYPSNNLLVVLSNCLDADLVYISNINMELVNESFD